MMAKCVLNSASKMRWHSSEDMWPALIWRSKNGRSSEEV